VIHWRAIKLVESGAVLCDKSILTQEQLSQVTWSPRGARTVLSAPPPDRRESTEADAEKKQRAGLGNFGELACEARQSRRVNLESVAQRDVGSDVYRADRRENHVIRRVNGLRVCPVVVEGVYENHGGRGRTSAWWSKALATAHTERFRDVDQGSEISERADQGEAGVVNQLAALATR